MCRSIRAVICSCIGKLLLESVSPAFVERKNAFRCNFYTIRVEMEIARCQNFHS